MRLTLTPQDSSGFDNHLQLLVPGKRPDIVCREETRSGHRDHRDHIHLQGELHSQRLNLTYDPNHQLIGGIIPPHQQRVVDDEVAGQEVGIAVDGGAQDGLAVRADVKRIVVDLLQ